MPAVGIEVLHTGSVPMPDAYVYRGSGPKALQLPKLLAGPSKRCPCLAYVLNHPTEGKILIDTGFHPDAADLREDFGFPLSLVFRGLRPDPTPYTEQLSARGVDPSSVERVVMTHLHADHTSAMRLLPGATFTIDSREWASATGKGAGGRGYVAKHLPPPGRVETIDFDADGHPHGPFAATVDLLGDGSIRLVSTPGHTAGHLSVLVDTGEGPPTLLLGDAAYTLRNIREEILPLMTDDDEAFRTSLAEVKEFMADEPGATVIPTHDPEAWQAPGSVA